MMARSPQYYNTDNKAKVIIRNNAVDKATRIVLAILWAGTLVLLTTMIYRWQVTSEDEYQRKPRTAKDLFVDDMLLSAGDMELQNTSSLINITLNSAQKRITQTTAGRKTEANSDAIETNNNVIYNRILTQKVKKAKTEYTNGFTIKPLPQ